MQLANYLFFTTQCEPALEFYARCGLGRFTVVARHAAGPLQGKSPKNAPAPFNAYSGAGVARSAPLGMV